MEANIKIVEPVGILDGTKSEQFRQQIAQLVKEGAQTILIDFHQVTFMDSSGLGSLVLCLKTVRSAGANLYLCSINEQIKILFDLTSMDRIFEIFPDRDAFSAQFLT